MKASLELHWTFEGNTLITSGSFRFKLPLREKMEFSLSGRDSPSELKFRYDDHKKYFGSWSLSADRVFFEDQRKKAEYVVAEPVMSVGAMLFCALQTQYERAQTLYVSGDKAYRIEFLRNQNAICIFLAEEKKNVGNLFLENGKVSGGEIILPVLGKIHFGAERV